MESLKSSFFGRLFADSIIMAGLVTRPTLPIATVNQPTPGLLRCPIEVLASVFNNSGLNKDDLKAARLICKELQPAATREFARRYFTDPFVILSSYSLETLVEICKHPDFSPYVQSIGFLTTTLYSGSIGDRALRYQNAILEKDKKCIKQSLAKLNAVTQFTDEQVYLECSGKAEKLLASAISALGRPVTVTVTNDIASINPIGVSKVPSDRYYNSSYIQEFSKDDYNDDNGYSEVESRMKDLLRLVPNAIYQMDLGDRKHFEGLKIRIKERSYMLKRDDYLGTLRASEGIYRCLTSLHLEVDCASLRNKGSIAALQHLFTVVPCLQKLTFVTSWTRGNTIATLLLTNTGRWLETPSKFDLRVLVIQEVACTKETLLSIMKSHSKTLREIELSGVTLLGSWRECISWMIDNLHLEKFCIKNACNIRHDRKTNHRRFIPADCLVEPTDLVGEKDTRAGLEKLLKHKFER
ncbi:hypothetical protein D6C86_05101 [Aureobasidium pullulans]|uniref:Uncharacterized protein n=1 Tax=Aureobasidium pullulans TaxID=5580 RepID=A0A4S9UMQ2_AURPU|nr:hypothetical protein D6C94_05537 [Aureobasidium pullulans]THZ39993.1 hypothetical protein D6C87_06755 [Aureobasidium pullulans]THZ60429.1 hypothetical protein D6C86_05101 [Aureobasidium pullulans]